MYAGLKSLQVETAAETSMDVGAGPARVRVPTSLFFSRPDKARIETKNAENVLQMVIIFDGTTLTEYDAWKNEYSQTPRGRLQLSFSPERGVGYGEMLYNTIAKRVKSAETRGHEQLTIDDDVVNCTIVDVKYETRDRDLKYSFWIEPTRGVVFRRVVTFWDKGREKRMDASVKALTLDADVPSWFFHFEQPPNTRRTSPGNRVGGVVI